MMFHHVICDPPLAAGSKYSYLTCADLILGHCGAIMSTPSRRFTITQTPGGQGRQANAIICYLIHVINEKQLEQVLTPYSSSKIVPCLCLLPPQNASWYQSPSRLHH